MVIAFKGVIALAMGGFDGSININTKIDSSGFNRGVKDIGKGLDGITSSLKGLAAAVGVAFGIAAAVNFGKASVKASTDLSNALLGLRSILQGQGRDFQSAQDFINKYTADGLIPATNAITAYKNLASRGYTDVQIQKTLQALKDSAAFGRQASYSLGEAVSTATEGLKNENSILVDNAGVTKNVAKMWEDYGKSIGVSSNDLTKAQKIQAEYNGIMEETRFQTGDAAKLSNTYSGSVQQLGFSFNNLKIAVGNALIPIAQAVLPSINAIISSLTQVANLFAQVSTALFGKQAAQQSNVAKTANSAAAAQNNLAKSTKAANQAAQDSTASWDKLNVLQKDNGATSTAATPDSSTGSVTGATGSQGLGAGVTVSPAVQAAVDAFKRIIAPLQSIDFTNLNNAFGGLADAVKPLGRTLFSGLEWAYNNIFVPFAKWTIQDAAPAFLRLLSGAADLLNSVLTALQPLAIWLWNNFLQPLATWTGGIIVSVLNNLADALFRLSDWISQNGETTRSIIIGIGAAFLTWKIEMALSSLATLFSLLKDVNSLKSFGTLLGMLINDKFPKLASVMKLLPLAALALSIGVLVAVIYTLVTQWNTLSVAMKVALFAIGALAVVIGVVTVAQMLFNVSLLASPITWIIIGIVALVAAFALLWQNCDGFRQFWINLWNGIVAIIQSVIAWVQKNWPSMVLFLINPIAGVFNYFYQNCQQFRDFWNNIWNSIVAVVQNVLAWVQKNWPSIVLFIINPIAGIFNYFYQNSTDFRNFINNTLSQIGGFFANLWSRIQSIFGGVGNWFRNVFSAAVNGIKSVFSSIGGFFQGIWNTIRNMFTSIGTTIGDSIGGAFKAVINSIIDFAQNNINGFIKSINNAIGTINHIPGVNIGYIQELSIPHLATGAVIPPRAEFAAILGDQRSGTNIEAPADLIRSIFAEELSKINFNPQVVVKASGSDSELVRWMKFEIEKESNRVGGKFATGGGRA